MVLGGYGGKILGIAHIHELWPERNRNVSSYRTQGRSRQCCAGQGLRETKNVSESISIFQPHRDVHLGDSKYRLGRRFTFLCTAGFISILTFFLCS